MARPPAEAGAAMDPCWQSLPWELQLRIAQIALTLQPSRDWKPRRVLPAVCKAWERLVYSRYRSLSVDLQDSWASDAREFRRLLSQAGKAMQVVRLVAAVRPAADDIEEFVHEELMHESTNALPLLASRLQRLQYLTLAPTAEGSEVVHLLAMALVAAVPQLASLSLCRPAVIPGHIGSLPALTSLYLDFSWHPYSLHLPASLSGLRRLEIIEVEGAEYTNQLPGRECVLGGLRALAALPALRRLHLCTVWLEPRDYIHKWLPGLTRLTELVLCIRKLGGGDDVPEGLGDGDPDTEFPERPGFSVEQWEAALRPLTQLSVLSIANNRLTAVPPCVAGMPQLSELWLCNNDELEGLFPAGPYQRSLQRLAINGCTSLDPDAMVSVLPQMSALTSLELSGCAFTPGPWHPARVAGFGRAQMEQLLQRLQRLRHITVRDMWQLPREEREVAQQAADELEQQLPGRRVRFL